MRRFTACAAVPVPCRGIGAVAADGGITADVNTYGSAWGCQRFQISARMAGDEFTGTWTQQLDCHGLARWGHLTGRQ